MVSKGTYKGVGFTGTQVGMTPEQVTACYDILAYIDADEFHHGDCIGADEQAHTIARNWDFTIHIHPPLKEEKRAWCKGDIMYPAWDYLIRNYHIVEASDILLATPKGFEEEVRSGTWATVRYARKKGIKVIIIYPDGAVHADD